ncbi:MAG TPA: ATP-grasp domain-containing protein, partial [Actinomycetota bacterium]
MDLYEHMGKELFRAQGMPTPLGVVARSPGEAADAARRFGGKAVVKVQVQAGGRGKGGGVVLVDSPERASEEAARLLRDGFAGRPVDRVLVEEQLPIEREFYTSILLDRSNGEYLAMMTAEGGVDIETLAAERPEAIRRVHVDPMLGLRGYHVRELVGTLPPEAREGAADVLRHLFALLRERDATLVEVNPLVQLSDGRVVALDAKVTIDDNALVRHPDLAELAREFPIDPVEQRAKDAGLQYVKLEGAVGIIGNGAGLVMSTLDVVKAAGGEAANFLDVGGGAGAELLSSALEVITSDPN